jgi:futalosine hydrolase
MYLCSMSTCIVAATALELQYLSGAIKEKNTVLITGVGTAATVYHLMQELQHNKPSLVLQAGIAGSFNEALKLGQAVVVNADRFADLGVHENNQWKDVFDMKLTESESHPYSNGWVINPHHDLLSATGLPIVKSISINEVTTSSARIGLLRHKYNPSIESMEGAAFHYVCLQQGIPFIQLRTISNYVGERNKDKWKLREAVEMLAGQIQEITARIG